MVSGKKIGSNTDIEIGSWFRFPILKSGFDHTLPTILFLCCDRLSTYRCYQQKTTIVKEVAIHIPTTTTTYYKTTT